MIVCNNKSKIILQLVILTFTTWIGGSSTSRSEQILIKSPILFATPEIFATKTNTVIHKITPAKTILSTSTAISTVEHFGCLRPPDDHSCLLINGHWLSQRTLFKLQHVYNLYGGAIDITERAITQGHYNDLEPLSFGTHTGGGVVDISVIDATTWKVLYEEIELLILAIRRAGFAAWLRDFDELNPGYPIHIHAVAVGDRDLSKAAQEQLTGQYGYFRGYSGLLQESGNPVASTIGELIICSWMLELGYQDLRLQ